MLHSLQPQKMTNFNWAKRYYGVSKLSQKQLNLIGTTWIEANMKIVLKTLVKVMRCDEEDMAGMNLDSLICMATCQYSGNLLAPNLNDQSYWDSFSYYPFNICTRKNIQVGQPSWSKELGKEMRENFNTFWHHLGDLNGWFGSVFNKIFIILEFLMFRPVNVFNLHTLKPSRL